MKKTVKLLAIAVLSMVVATACNSASNTEAEETITTDTIEEVVEQPQEIQEVVVETTEKCTEKKEECTAKKENVKVDISDVKANTADKGTAKEGLKVVTPTSNSKKVDINTLPSDKSTIKKEGLKAEKQ